MVKIDTVGSHNVETSSECFMDKFQRTRVAHVDPSKNLIADLPFGFVWGFVGCKTDVAFAIEQASSVVNESFRDYLSVTEEGCEVGGNPMPGPKGCGRTIPSQAEGKASGVCREHGQPPKGMMCSDLGRNVERPAEMTGPDMYAPYSECTYLVTECNTDYLFLRYAPRRLFKPLERVQSINQDAIAQLITFAGNMTCSNRKLQGVLIA